MLRSDNFYMKKPIKNLIGILILFFFSITNLFAGGFPTIDVTAMLNWITKFSRDTKDKIQEKIVWVQDVQTAIEHLKQMEEYWNQLKGIKDNFTFNGIKNSLGTLQKMNQEVLDMQTTINDTIDDVEYAYYSTKADLEKISKGNEEFDEKEKEVNKILDDKTKTEEEKNELLINCINKIIKGYTNDIKDLEKKTIEYQESKDKFIELYNSVYKSTTWFEIESSEQPQKISTKNIKSEYDKTKEIEVFYGTFISELNFDATSAVGGNTIDFNKYYGDENYNVICSYKIATYNSIASSTEKERSDWVQLATQCSSQRDSAQSNLETLYENLEGVENAIKKSDELIAENNLAIQRKQTRIDAYNDSLTMLNGGKK